MCFGALCICAGLQRWIFFPLPPYLLLLKGSRGPLDPRFPLCPPEGPPPRPPPCPFNVGAECRSVIVRCALARRAFVPDFKDGSWQMTHLQLFHNGFKLFLGCHFYFHYKGETLELFWTHCGLFIASVQCSMTNKICKPGCLGIFISSKFMQKIYQGPFDTFWKKIRALLLQGVSYWNVRF